MFVRKMLLFHILYQCLFKDSRGLFCERSIYIHILVPLVLYSNSVDLSSSHSISKLHFIQCHKFYIHTHTHRFHITISTILLHTTDIRNLSVLTRFFCKHFAKNFHPYKVKCYVSQFLFTWPAVLFTNRWSKTDIRFFVSPIILSITTLLQNSEWQINQTN